MTKFYRETWTAKYEEDGISAGRTINEFNCRYCSKDYKLGNEGEKAIKQHISNARHVNKKEGHHPTDQYNQQVQA